MKSIPQSLQDHLDTGTTTICQCWEIRRNDGPVFGFTNHDADLHFRGIDFLASSGMTSSEVQESLGFSVDNFTVSGGLTSASITESDIISGLYDNAEIIVYDVNWQSPADYIVKRKGRLGECKRNKTGFYVEVLGMAEQFNTEHGRKYQFTCDADFGDARCGVDAAQYTDQGTVVLLADQRRFSVSGISPRANDFFSWGYLIWQTGANSGLKSMVKLHTRTVSQSRIEIWEETPNAIVSGDTFLVTAGCDKQRSSCHQKFANILNFRGFEFMPGNDALVARIKSNDDLDGGSRYGN